MQAPAILARLSGSPLRLAHTRSTESRDVGSTPRQRRTKPVGLLSDHHNISSVGVGEKWGPIADYDIGLRSERSRCVEEGRGQILTVISTNASLRE
jgi:hypothetical protein